MISTHASTEQSEGILKRGGRAVRPVLSRTGQGSPLDAD
jgi:hypothetical protein